FLSNRARANVREWRASGSRNSRKVSLLENLPVMQFVPGGDKCKRPHTHFIFIGHTASQPRLAAQRTEQRQSRASHIREFLHQTRQLPFLESAAAHVIVLFESGHRRLVRPRNSQRPVGENSLGVAEVAEHILYCPLVRRVAKIAVALAAPGKNLHRLYALRLQRARDVFPRYQRNIFFVIRRVLPALRSPQIHFRSPQRSIPRLDTAGTRIRVLPAFERGQSSSNKRNVFSVARRFANVGARFLGLSLEGSASP